MTNTYHLTVLKMIHARLQNTTVNWVLTGSLAFALQGVPVTVNDIDVQTDRTGAYEIERLFNSFVKHRVQFSSTEKIRSHFGTLSIMGIQVEIMGDVQKRLRDGSWEPPFELDRYKKFIPFENEQLPVLSLAYEYEAYLKMGRVETATLLKGWLDERAGS